MMKQILYRFNRFNIKKQYLILMLCSFLIMFLLSILIFFQARNAILETSDEYASMLSDAFSAEIAFISDQASSICEQIQYDACSTRLLDAKSWHEISAEIITELTREKIFIREVNTSVTDIAYVNDFIYWSSLYTKEQLEQMVHAIDGVKETTSLGIFYGDLPSHRNEPHLVFGGPIYVDYQCVGYVFISIHLTKLSLPVMQQNDTSACFLLTDSQFHTFAFNCDQTLADDIIQNIRPDDISFMKKADSASSYRTSNHYAVNFQYVPNADCYIISAVHIPNTTSRLGSITILCWTVAIVMILLLILVYFVLYRNYVTPIRTFHQIIQDTEASHLRTLKEPLNLNGCEEIRQIGNSFTSLLTSIDNLNRKIVRTSNELYEMELQKKIAELSYLRSQINPHFLYNTLELMRDISTAHSVPQIARIAVSMGKILRYSIKGESMVPLQQEIDITMAYLNIQQARFHDRILILQNFQPKTLGIYVPKMLLQPLVENAVFHGLEPKPESGTLLLGSVLEQNILKITIRDNGVGISEMKLQEIQDSLYSPLYDTSKHMGLVNTNARIQLQYGKAYGVTLKSTEGDGTCLTLTLPAKLCEKKE